MTILIGLPAYPGFIKTDCVLSLMATQAALLAKGVKVDVARNQPADIVLARNILGSMVLQTERFTHLLFVDNDMQFDAQTVLRLIEFNKPVAGGIYRRKKQEPDYVVRYAEGQPRVSIEGGFCRVDGIGMGLCLIQRSAFVELAATGQLRSSEKHGEIFKLPGALHGFFDPLPDSEGELLPEDFSFCQRWRTLCNGTVWALADADIGHIGEFTYQGNYLDHLKGKA